MKPPLGPKLDPNHTRAVPSVMWRDDDRPSHSQEACAQLLNRFLLAPQELLHAFTPEGWERSPLLRIFHPTPEQLRAEAERMRRNLAELWGRSKPDDTESRGHEPQEPREPGEPEEPAAPRTVKPEREVVELLGCALWDVFSDNHTVVDAEGKAYDLGSFRASGGFIAEAINRRYPGLGARYDYIDFYMGTALCADRADLRPVYRWIFTRLKEASCDWIYTFPRLYLVDLAGPGQDDDMLRHDPSEAVRAELEEADRAEKLEDLAEDLEHAHEEAVRSARHAPLPAIVAAYREVCGALPEGWPHPEM